MAANDLLTLIRDKQTQIAKLQAELDEARALLLGETRAAAVTSKIASPIVTTTPKGRHLKRTKKRARKIPPTSSVARAIQLMREAGGPLDVETIIRETERRFNQQVKKDTLVGNLSRYVKAGDIFYRSGTSTYGLLELKEKEQKAS